MTLTEQRVTTAQDADDEDVAHYEAEPPGPAKVASPSGIIMLRWMPRISQQCSLTECMQYPLLAIEQELDGYHTHRDGPDLLCWRIRRWPVVLAGSIRYLPDDEVRSGSGCPMCGLGR